MEEKIKKVAADFVGTNSIMFVASKDLSMEKALVKAFGSDIKVEASEDITIGGFIIVFINLAIGMVIFYPFWKAYEKSEVKRLEDEAAATVAANA